MLVSVIMPAFNAAPYLEAAIQSVLAQTLPDFELLIGDDGSSDGTADIALSVKDQRIRVHRFLHAGVSATRNRLIDLASGDYVAFLDADDLWDPDKLRMQVEYLHQHPAIVLVACRLRYCSADGLRFMGATGTWNPSQLSAVRAAQLMPFAMMSSAVVRTSALLAAGPLDEMLGQAEDLDLLARIARLGEISMLPDVLGSYRVHARAASATGFIEGQLAQRYVAGRFAGDRVSALGWDHFKESAKPSWGQRRRWHAARHLRTSGVFAINSQPVRAVVHATAALALAPWQGLGRISMRLRAR